MTKLPLTLADFWDQLSRADWWYEMSDDPRVYQRGKIAMAELREAAAQGAAFKQLFDDARQHKIHSAPMPERPKVPFVSGLAP